MTLPATIYIHWGDYLYIISAVSCFMHSFTAGAFRNIKKEVNILQDKKRSFITVRAWKKSLFWKVQLSFPGW